MNGRVPELVFLLIVIGLVAGFLLGRRKGRARLVSALSASHAAGMRDATTELNARLSQTVNVNAGNSGVPLSVPALSEYGPDDRIVALLRELRSELVVSEPAYLGAGRHDYNALHVSGSFEPSGVIDARSHPGRADRVADRERLDSGPS